MTNYQILSPLIAHTDATPWLNSLATQVEHTITHANNGHMTTWQEILRSLPIAVPSKTNLNRDCIQIGSREDLDQRQRHELEFLLKKLSPWRKGPFELFNIHIETEWRSDWKWNRLAPHITPLNDRVVLDVGCGSGYHCWRMAGEQAKVVIGIDPSLLFMTQFQAVQHFINRQNVIFLPFTLENMPNNLPIFDTVFSMGVLYHRRSPFDHLLHLRKLLKPKGELVLETLVIDGNANILTPENRYAKMNNVWCIPSNDVILGWLKKCGYENPRVVDVNQTSTEEQRSTDWMPFESLPDFLDSKNSQLTIEGYPAPKRAIFIATRSR